MGKHFTSREFNQNVSGVKRAADEGPVVITDRGKPAYVLMRHEEFAKLTSPKKTLAEMLAMPGGDDIDLESEIPPRRIWPPRPLDLD